MLSLLVAAALAATPADDAAAIRALRGTYNAAIASRDMAPIKGLFDPDYHLIRGATGAMAAGPEAMESILKADAAADPGFVGYERTPGQVEVSTGGVRAAEHGRWTGRWREPDGEMRLTGTYLAMWVKSAAGRWTVKSEAYVALKCEGSSACRRFSL